MKILKRLIIFAILLIGILLCLFVPEIDNDKQEYMRKELTGSIVREKLPKNYAIYLDIKRKYFVHIVSEKGKVIADFADYLERERGYLENGALKVYRNEKLISEEKCSLKQFQKKLGFNLNHIHETWIQKIRKTRLEGARCTKIITMTGHDYSWKFDKETYKDRFTFFIDTDKSGKNYDRLGILYDAEEIKGRIGYMMCFSNESPVGPSVVSDEDFSEDTQCYTYKELHDKWNS